MLVIPPMVRSRPRSPTQHAWSRGCPKGACPACMQLHLAIVQALPALSSQQSGTAPCRRVEPPTPAPTSRTPPLQDAAAAWPARAPVLQEALGWAGLAGRPQEEARHASVHACMHEEDLGWMPASHALSGPGAPRACSTASMHACAGCRSQVHAGPCRSARPTHKGLAHAAPARDALVD